MKFTLYKMPALKKLFIRKPVSGEGFGAETPFHFRGKKFNLLLILSVIGLCFILYGNTIPNGFSLDDEFVMQNDSLVTQGLKGIPQLFKHRYAWDQKGTYGYRPMVKVSYAIEYALFKDSPHWGHFINILLYALLSLFLFYFFRKLLYDWLGDYFLLTALLFFVAHPIHTEVVASLKNRDEMLVFLFGFYASYAMLNWIGAKKMLSRILWGISGCLSLAAGILCKPDAVIFVPITALILYFFSSNGLRASVSSLLVMGMSVLLLLKIINHHLLPHSSYHRLFTYIEDPLVGVHWYQKFPLAFSTVWFYISKMVFPKNLISYYGYNAFNAFAKWTDLSVMAGILLTILLIYLIIKNARNKALLFILLFFAITAFPYTDITEIGPGIVAERFMFIPSVGFLFLVTYLLFYVLKIPVDKKPSGRAATYGYAFTITVLALFSGRVLARNGDWKSRESLYVHDTRVAPNSAKLQALLGGSYYVDAQQRQASNPQQRADIIALYNKAWEAYKRSVEIYPQYVTSWNNIGMIGYLLNGNAPAAISSFEKAIKIDSTYTEAWLNLGICYEGLARRAIDTLRHDSAVIDRKDFYMNETPASIHEKMDSCKSRIEIYRTVSERSYLHAIESSPNNTMAYVYLANLYSSEEQYHKIVEMDSTAIKKGYRSSPLYITLGNAFIMLRDSDHAAQCYEKSLRFNTKNYYIANFLQQYYYKKGDMRKADYYKQVYDYAMSIRGEGRTQ